MSDLAFVREWRAEIEPLYRKITGHPLVLAIERGELTRDKLRTFAEQEYYYIEHIYDYFALGVLNARMKEAKELFIAVAHREVEYTAAYLRFLEELGIEESELRAGRILPGAIAAPNYLFHLAVSGTTGENLSALIPIEETWIQVCAKIYPPLREHYRISEEAAACFSVPPIDFKREEQLLERCAGSDEDKKLMLRAARLALDYEAMFFDAVFAA